MEKVCPQCERRYTGGEAFCSADRSALRLVIPISSDELIGQVIDDRYLIIEALGAGGMGKVYLGHHVLLDRKAAIKVLHRRYLEVDPDAVARFKRTASDASKIVNEHVASIFDYGETTDGLFYLAMEFVPGPTIGKLQKSEGPLAPQRVAAFVLHVGDALDATHQHGIVHRDLKPDNIIVTKDSSGGEIAKLIDFGIAKAVHGDARQQSQGGTQVGMLIGTPYYMSPEQLTGQVIDRRSDVYALGLLTFSMLTGEPAYDPETPFEALLAERVGKPPRRLADALPSVRWPAGLQQVLDQSMHPDREKRFATAGGFAVSMATVLGVATMTRPGGHTPMGGVARVLPTAGVPSGPVGDDVTGSNAAEPRPGSEAIARLDGDGPIGGASANRRRRWLIPATVTLAAIAVGGAGLWYALGRNTGATAADASAAEASGDTTQPTVAVVTPIDSAPPPAKGDEEVVTPPVRGDRAKGGSRDVGSAPRPNGAASDTPRTPSSPPASGSSVSSSPAVSTGELRASLARWDRELGDVNLEVSPATAERMLSALRDLEFIRRMPTVDDSALAYLVESQALLVVAEGDDTRTSCAVLERSRQVGARSAFRRRYVVALGLCGGG